MQTSVNLPVIHFGQQRPDQWQADQPGQRLQHRYFAHQQDISIHFGQNPLIFILNMQFGQRLARVDTDLSQLLLPAGDVDPADIGTGFTGEFFIGRPVFNAFRTGAVIIDVDLALC
jgi:hypothetical protein